MPLNRTYAAAIRAEGETLLVVGLDDLDELSPAQSAPDLLQRAQKFVDPNPTLRVELDVDQFRLVAKDSREVFAVAGHMSSFE